MILVDTGNLSTFARVDALSHLWELFPGTALAITPAIFREVQEAKNQGYGWLNQVITLVSNKRRRFITCPRHLRCRT